VDLEAIGAWDVVEQAADGADASDWNAAADLGVSPTSERQPTVSVPALQRTPPRPS
jgi:hypothetical protein